MVTEPNIVNTFVVHALHRKITHSAVIVRKRTENFKNLKIEVKAWKSEFFLKKNKLTRVQFPIQEAVNGRI